MSGSPSLLLDSPTKVFGKYFRDHSTFPDHSTFAANSTFATLSAKTGAIEIAKMNSQRVKILAYNAASSRRSGAGALVRQLSKLETKESHFEAS